MVVDVLIARVSGNQMSKQDAILSSVWQLEPKAHCEEARADAGSSSVHHMQSALCHSCGSLGPSGGAIQ